MNAALLLLALLLQEKPATLEEIAKRLGLEVLSEPGALYPLKTPSGAITGKAPTAGELKTYKPLLATEIGKYPKGFVEKTGLKKIVLSKDLQLAGQKRAAIPDWVNHVLHLDAGEGSWLPAYQKSVIHHELFHIVDHKDDGRLYDDKEWKKLNSPDFKYGSGGKNARGGDQWAWDDSLEGFLNKYSTSGVEEDKAEIFANLMVRNGDVLKRAEKDKILANKVERMKSLLKTFSKDMDDEFWKALEKGR